MASDVARFLMTQYLSSLDDEDNSHSSSKPILARFKAIGEKLKANSTALTSPESISWLSDLNEALTEWRILKDQNKSIKRIFSVNEQSPINTKLNELERSTVLEASSSSITESSQPNLLLLDWYTVYKPDRIISSEDEVSDEREKQMVDWLLTSGDHDFTAVGIYGTGGSGKSALVKNVLKQKSIGIRFKSIIWVCLSELTIEEEIDVRIIEYFLYRLGLDTDSLAGNIDENRDWLVEELERRLLNSGNYILVLDDMWRCSKWLAGELLGKLKKNGGGAVILTSRRKTVAEIIGDKNKLLHLNPSAYKESTFLKPKYRLGR